MSTRRSQGCRKVFDYTRLDAGTSQFVQQQTGEIQALMKRTAQDIIEIGRKLIQVKEKLGHGSFLVWLEAEFEWSYPTATRFMQVANSFSQSYQIDKFAPSALYELAAPSTPQTAREEAIARAEAGEPITYTTAKAIKQKHSLPPEKPKSKLVSQPQTIPALVETAHGHSQPEILAILPQGQVTHIPQPPQLDYRLEQPSIWWQLGKRHLLYCGDPNSPEFLQQIPEKVGLLLAFPPSLDWQSKIQAETRIIATRYLPQGKDVRLFEDTLEPIILLYSKLGETVISCFLPSPKILSIINRLERCGLFAEPDSKRSNEVILDWKAGGLKAERVSL